MFYMRIQIEAFAFAMQSQRKYVLKQDQVKP